MNRTTLRVLHVIPSVDPLEGGPAALIRVLTQQLADQGLDVHVITTDHYAVERPSAPYATPVFEGNVTYWYFPRQISFYKFSWPLNAWLAEHIKKYTVVHIHALFSWASNNAAYWAKRLGVPYIIRPLGVLNRWGMQNRHPWFKKISFRMIEGPLLRGAAAIHYTSEQERQEAAELGIQQRAVIIPNAISLPQQAGRSCHGQFRKRYPQLTNRCLILFLSRLDQKKGLDLLLPAFAQLHAQEPEVMLILAGDGEAAFIASLKKRAAALGIAEHILWTGFLDAEKKWAAFADADIFVLPSYSENFGIAAVEAMSAGLPVVVSDQVGIYREIVDASAGLAVACNPQVLSQALTELSTNPELRQKMGRKGKLLVQQHFSQRIMISRLIQLYEETAREPLP